MGNEADDKIAIEQATLWAAKSVVAEAAPSPGVSGFSASQSTPWSSRARPPAKPPRFACAKCQRLFNQIFAIL
jgi:hypothetical protein